MYMVEEFREYIWWRRWTWRNCSMAV